LTFKELVELTFVREFETAGVTIGHIRNTAEALVKTYGETKWLVANWDRIWNAAKSMQPGTCFVIDRSGQIKDI